MQLTNAQITEVKRATEGTKNDRHWTLYNLKMEGKTFGLFRSDEDYVPLEGDVVSFVEYEEKQNGKFVNRTIKKFVMGEAPKPQMNKIIDFIPDSMLFSYIKDMEIASPESVKSTLSNRIERVIKGVFLAKRLLQQDTFEPQPPDDDPIPY
jgi:hypothetical protein